MSKKIFSVVLIVVLLAGLLYGCGEKENGNSNTEQQTYTNNKPISDNVHRDNSDRFLVQSYGELLNFTDIIVEGEVISEGEAEQDSYPKVPGTPDDHELNRKDKVEVTLTKFKVTRVLYGELESDIITIGQLGPPKTNIGEIKIEKGQKLICFLRIAEFVDGRESSNFYASVDWENGFYDITDENSMRAFSNVNGLCTYDGKPSSEFIKEIESIINNYIKK